MHGPLLTFSCHSFAAKVAHGPHGRYICGQPTGPGPTVLWDRCLGVGSDEAGGEGRDRGDQRRGSPNHPERMRRVGDRMQPSLSEHSLVLIRRPLAQLVKKCLTVNFKAFFVVPKSGCKIPGLPSD